MLKKCSFIITITNLLHVSVNYIFDRRYLYFPKQGKCEKSGIVLCFCKFKEFPAYQEMANFSYLLLHLICYGKLFWFKHRKDASLNYAAGKGKVC